MRLVPEKQRKAELGKASAFSSKRMVWAKSGAKEKGEEHTGEHGDLGGASILLFCFKCFSAHSATAARDTQNIESKCEVGGVSFKIGSGGKGELEEVACGKPKLIATTDNALSQGAGPGSRATFQGEDGHVGRDAAGDPTTEVRGSSGFM